MTDYELPSKARVWLDAVQHALSNIEPLQRAEIVDGLRAHIIEALGRGDTVDVVLSRLGSPDEIADLAEREELVTVPSRVVRSRHLTGRRVAQFAAFGLAIVAFASLAPLPGYVENTFDSNGEITSTTTTIALFNMDRMVAAILIVAILLTGTPLIVRGRAQQPVTVGVAVILVAFAAISTLWIVGWFIMPAAVASLIAACIRPSTRPTAAPELEPVKLNSN